VDRNTGVELLVALAVGLGDGLVGQVPFVDKYPTVHTVYRLGTLAAGAVGAITERIPDAVAGPMMISSVALLASRVPAVVNGGGFQQFG
jgi:hypothetical protein